MRRGPGNKIGLNFELVVFVSWFLRVGMRKGKRTIHAMRPHSFILFTRMMMWWIYLIEYVRSTQWEMGCTKMKQRHKLRVYMKTSSVGVRCQFLHHARLSLLHTTE